MIHKHNYKIGREVFTENEKIFLKMCNVYVSKMTRNVQIAPRYRCAYRCALM